MDSSIGSPLKNNDHVGIIIDARPVVKWIDLDLLTAAVNKSKSR